MQRAVSIMEEGFRPLGGNAALHHPGPIYLENDSYYWLDMAETMRSTGVWRIRETTADNTPFGRPVYWSQSVAWLIAGLASLPVFSGVPSPEGAASLWLNPLLHAATVWALLLLLWPLGLRVACLAAVLFVSLGDLLWAFSPLRPDHQSLQVAFLVVCLAALLREGFGFGRPALAPAVFVPARWPFVVAGVAVGAGLWVSAAAMMPLLTFLAAAVCASGLAAGVEDGNAGGRARRNWFVWGAAAGSVSLAFWLVEFFPEAGRSRLEVNNPAFSLWVFGLGAGMALAMGPRVAGENVISRAGPVAAVGLLCGILPGVILFGPAEWYWPRQEVMNRMHNFILEFYTFSNQAKGRVWSSLWNLFQTTLPLAFALALFAWPRRFRHLRPVVAVMLTMLAALFAMSMQQVRWIGLFSAIAALSAALTGGWLAALAAAEARRALGAAVIALVVLQAGYLAYLQTTSLRGVVAGKSLLTEIVPFVLNKQFALALTAREDRPTAVLADPNLVPSLWYFARVPGMVSFYWENLEGLHDAVEVFAGDDPEKAREVLQRRGISHIIVPSGPLLPNYFDFMRHGHYNTTRAADTLAATLTEGSPLSLPPWLETDDALDRIGKTPFVYRGETIEQYLNIYRVVPPPGNSE